MTLSAQFLQIGTAYILPILIVLDNFARVMLEPAYFSKLLFHILHSVRYVDMNMPTFGHVQQRGVVISFTGVILSISETQVKIDCFNGITKLLKPLPVATWSTLPKPCFLAILSV